MSTRIAAGFALAMLFTGGANAAPGSVLDLPYVTVEAPDQVFVGDTFTVSIIGDFQGLGLLAGGVQFSYDPSRLSANAFEFDLVVFSDLSCPGAALCPDDPPGTLSIVWGQIHQDLIPPNNGPTLMGTISMTAIGCCGEVALDLVTLDDLTGGWFGSAFVPMAAPDFAGATIRVNPIPLPAAVWLMLGGLASLARFRRSSIFHPPCGSGFSRDLQRPGIAQQLRGGGGRAARPPLT